MSLRDDRRGQAIQVGAVLLFAILVIAFSTYQAVIVPADNRRVEFNHNQEVQSQLAELRNAITSTTESEGARSVTVALGTQYPSRTLGLNPPSPSGSLRTVGTTDSQVGLSIRNATAEGETGDLWDGTPMEYNTGGIGYRPVYHQYDGAPETVYEGSVLFNQFDDATLVTANQTFIDGNRISLIALNGSLARTSSATTTVDVSPISSSSETILIDEQGPDAPITLSFTSTLSADRWERILSDEDNVVDVSGSPSPAGSEYNAIRVTLDDSVEYRLKMTKAGVGQGATDEDVAYLTDVAGDGARVQRGTSQTLTLAVRDRFNNPVSGVTVTGAVEGPNGGSLDETERATDVEGEVTFTYTTNGATETGVHTVDFTTEDSSVLTGSSFAAETTANVTTEVTVTAGSGGGSGEGAYAVNWIDPSSESENGDLILSNCSAESCTWDVGGSTGSSLALNATLTPPFDGVDLDFAVNDSSVATLSTGGATTGSNGAARADLVPVDDGTVEVLSSGSASSDTIAIAVENVVAGLIYKGDANADEPGYGTGDEQAMVAFNVTNRHPGTITLTGFTYNSSSPSSNPDLSETEFTPYHEVWIDTNGDGSPDGNQDGNVEEGDYVDLDETASMTSESTAEVRLYHFQTTEYGGGPPRDVPVEMGGEDLTVTLHYTDSDGDPKRTTIEMTNIPD